MTIMILIMIMINKLEMIMIMKILSTSIGWLFACNI